MGQFEEADPHPTYLLRNGVVIAQATLILIGNIGGRRHPRRICKVKKLRHIYLGSVPLGQAGQLESGLDQLQNCGEIRGMVGHVILSSEWRHHQQRDPVAGIGKVTIRAGSYAANVVST